MTVKYHGEPLLSHAPPWAHVIYGVHCRLTSVARAEWNGALFRWMPYVVHATADPHKRVILNRRYKPLGQAGQEFAIYETAHTVTVDVEQFEAWRMAGILSAGGWLHMDADTPRMGYEHFDTYRAKLMAMIYPYLIGVSGK